MGKEKKSVLDNDKKDLTFYYEILGIICIVVALLGFARLGIVGYYIMLSFKIIFGDWYFLIIIAMVLFGLHCLIYHVPLKIKNMRSIGISLIIMGMLILTHFSMHNYVAEYGTNYLSLTFNLYLDYFRNYQDGMILGGGFVGSLLFYAIYSLFSKIGTAVFVMVILFVGIAFTCKKTVVEFLQMIWSILGKFFGRGKKVMHTLKFEISRQTKPTKPNVPKPIKITTEILDPAIPIKYLSSEEKHAETVLKTISNLLNLFKVTYRPIKYLISHKVTSFYLNLDQDLDQNLFNARLSQLLNEDFLIRHDHNKRQLVLEVNNIYDNKINIRNLISIQPNFFNNLVLPLGITTENRILEVDLTKVGNLLIIGKNYQTPHLLHLIILELMIKAKNHQYKIEYYHLSSPSDLLTGLDFVKATIGEDIEHFEKEIELRLDLLNNSFCNTIDEYNLKQSVKIDPTIVIIDGFEQLIDIAINNSDYLTKLHYLLQLGPKAGFYFIFKLNQDRQLPHIVSGMLTTRIILKNDFKITVSTLGVDTLLISKEEAILTEKDQLKRFTISTTSSEEINRLKAVIEKGNNKSGK